MSSAEPTTERTEPDVRAPDGRDVRAPDGRPTAPGTVPVVAPAGESAPAAFPGPLPGLAESVRLLAASATTSTALVADALARIEATRTGLNAFRHLRAEAALAEAAEADRRLAAGERLPLLGVPVAVKDDTDVAGLPTHFGCDGERPPATADSEAVRRLRAAGADRKGAA